MITPGYSPTATERVLPRLALDFTTASLDARVTVARSLNTATRVNSSGLIEAVNANLPRFDFDPITKVCKGLLIEESRTQTARGTDIMSQWSKSAATGVANVIVSPSGAQDADLIYPSSSGNDRQVYTQSTTVPTSGSVAISVFAADAGLNWLIIYGFDSVTPLAWFDVANGVKGTVVAGWTSEIEPYENGFYRCSVVGTAVAGGYITFGIANADNSRAVTASGTNGLYFWGAQVEAGAFKTSYIANTDFTNGSSVTRNADAVSMTGTNFSDWYNATEGALLVQATAEIPATDANVRFAAAIYDTAAYANAFRLERLSGNCRAIKTVSGSSLVASYSWPIDVTGKAIMSYKDSSSASSFRAANPGLYAGGVPSGMAYLGIGGSHVGSNVWCGHVQRIQYWPQRLINAETQAFTKD